MAGSTWAGRRVLVTGHTGFKGSWLTAWLELLGAHVTGLSLPATPDGMYKTSSPWRHHNVEADLVEAELEPIVARAEPEVVFHLAAQSTVRAGYSAPELTWATNVMGTVRLLDALRHQDTARVILVTTTDKVYGSAPQTFSETDRLIASDPYAGSKVGQEMVVESFRDAYFDNGVHLVTARAGNVIGGGDAGPDRLVPDAVRATRAGETLELRCPDAVRPWQHVLDPIWGYLRFAEHGLSNTDTLPALNFGPDPANTTTVSELVAAFLHQLGGAPNVLSINRGPHMSENQHLTIDSTAATELLGWTPRLSTHEAVAWAAQWYSTVEAGRDPLEATNSQILRYQGLAG
ncbi:MAG: CDP-glucose 4,6-dehydratase [Acidimicrobiales bacterium]